ncbi:MAG: hypothetical protein ABH864_00600 [archaeon]
MICDDEIDGDNDTLIDCEDPDCEEAPNCPEQYAENTCNPPGNSGSNNHDESSGCVSSWQCEEWSECLGGTKTRSCIDLNNCVIEMEKPLTTINCLSDQETGSNGNDDPELPTSGNEGQEAEVFGVTLKEAFVFTMANVAWIGVVVIVIVGWRLRLFRKKELKTTPINPPYGFNQHANNTQ